MNLSLDLSAVIQIIILIILLGLSAFFSSAETSLTTINKIRLRSLAEEGNRHAKMALKVTDNSGKMLSSILIGNNIVNLSASALTTSIAYNFGGSAVAVATGLITVLILIFGEITPKTVATIHSETLALVYAYPIHFIMTIVTPISFIVNMLSRGILLLLRVNPNGKVNTMTETELRTIVDVSHEDGVIESEEKEMIYNVFDLGDAKAKDVMVPRVHVTFADVESTYDELLDIFREDKFTRLPVYEETTDNVIGTINMKDLLLFDNTKEFHVRDILREAYFTYEYKSISELLVEMREASLNIAIVLDEYGETAGLITLEDILEEIVGEIRDEYDENEEEFLKERNNLLNYEKNSQHIKNYKALMDSSKGIMDLFKQSLNELSYLEIDDIKHNYDQLYDLYYTVDGINQDIYDQFSQSYFSEEHYNEVQETFFKLNKLKRKYGQTIDAIIDFKNSLIEKIELFKNRDQMIENINLKLKETENQLIYYAKKISILRKNKALELEKEVKYILNQMYLQQVQFKFDFQINDFNDNGIDNVKIVVSTNSGQPLQPLQKIASGGELSRIMLAIKAVSQNSKDGGTIIFDEADTGVSGKVAESIGHVIKKISKKQQVICITHLAQVACFANNHLFIEKEQMDNTSKVHVRLLNEIESVYELAKMISGKEITQQSIDHAKKLKEICV